jgi:hypothetical protein
MIAQIITSRVGIRWNEPALSKWFSNFNSAYSNVSETSQGVIGSTTDGRAQASFDTNGSNQGTPAKTGSYINDNILPQVGDSLKVSTPSDLITVPFWWFLEFFPFKRRYQDLEHPNKKWKTSDW